MLAEYWCQDQKDGQKTNWEGLAYCFKAISFFLVGLEEASTLFREGIEMLVFSFLKK